MKHIYIIILTAAILTGGIFLPFVRGDYDHFSVGLSFIFQFAAFASLLLVPVGLIWCLVNFVKRKSKQQQAYPVYLRKLSFAIAILIIVAAALGAFASHNRFFAIIIAGIGIYTLFMVHKKGKQAKVSDSKKFHSTPYYFIFIPLAVVGMRVACFEKIKDKSTLFVIKQSEALINDIEAYKKTNGHFPVSLQSTIEDYHTGVAGIPRFHYEPRGNAYNLYFVQTSDMIGTEEIVMYNKLDEQEMTVHNQDLLRIPYNNIVHGHYKVAALPNQHWKIFYFD